MKEYFNFHTVRSKLIVGSKIAGGLLLLSYIVSVNMPVDPDISSVIWLFFVIALVMLIDTLLTRFISKPIAKLNHTAQKMADLDFSTPCMIATKDELGELGENLNRMADNLQQALSRLETANMQLEKDIERERLLLTERKELVDMLSHEMKTPLGVIRAYTEGLQDETDEGKKQKYVQIIVSEVEHMNDLIVTLLDLSALESGAAQLNVTCFDFVELVETVAGRLLIDAPDTNFILQYELPEQKVFVQTDHRRMEQVLENLIVNAKKNVHPDGILRLEVTLKDNTLYFSIFNHGRPIPENELPKIWTKFYRISGVKYTGSGLGLSIVAQILSMQKLTYGAENLADGVRFHFAIPIIK